MNNIDKIFCINLKESKDKKPVHRHKTNTLPKNMLQN